MPVANPVNDDEDEAFKKDNEKYLKMKKDGAGYKDIEKVMKSDGKTSDEFKGVVTTNSPRESLSVG